MEGNQILQPGVCQNEFFEIKINSKFGRHLVAIKDIRVGEKILYEKPFATTIQYANQSVCITCHEECLELITCRHCNKALFCGEKCRKSNDIHPFECSSFASNLNLVARTVLNALNEFMDVDEFMGVFESAKKRNFEFKEYFSDPIKTYEFFLCLHRAPADGKNLVDFRPLHHKLLQLTKFNKWFDTKTKEMFLLEIIEHHTHIVNGNAFKIEAENEKTEFIGKYTSLFSHSCAPNVTVVLKNGYISCITIRPVKKGSPLLVNYIQTLSDADRWHALKEDYQFECDCEKCIPRCTANDHDAMFNHWVYGWIQEHQMENDSMQFRSELKLAVIDFLNEFGDRPWSIEMEFIINIYVSCILADF